MIMQEVQYKFVIEMRVVQKVSNCDAWWYKRQMSAREERGQWR
jgi:hypothetical protein